jgi:asparagine synthase (glutamine-hydrolysing)
MCGIICVVGKYRYKEIPKALIERGRDDNGIYEDEYVQLIQTRLEITKCDVQLPYQDDRYVLLFNGEVYNWAEFGGANEYESIIEAFCSDKMDQLDGQFYIIIYDKFNNTLHHYQDDFKIHTVYNTNYHHSEIYASNLRSLPQIEFNKIQHQGFGNITTAAVL